MFWSGGERLSVLNQLINFCVVLAEISLQIKNQITDSVVNFNVFDFQVFLFIFPIQFPKCFQIPTNPAFDFLLSVQRFLVFQNGKGRVFFGSSTRNKNFALRGNIYSLKTFSSTNIFQCCCSSPCKISVRIFREGNFPEFIQCFVQIGKTINGNIIMLLLVLFRWDFTKNAIRSASSSNPKFPGKVLSVPESSGMFKSGNQPDILY